MDDEGFPAMDNEGFAAMDDDRFASTHTCSTFASPIVSRELGRPKCPSLDPQLKKNAEKWVQWFETFLGEMAQTNVEKEHPEVINTASYILELVQQVLEKMEDNGSLRGMLVLGLERNALLFLQSIAPAMKGQAFPKKETAFPRVVAPKNVSQARDKIVFWREEMFTFASFLVGDHLETERMTSDDDGEPSSPSEEEEEEEEEKEEEKDEEKDDEKNKENVEIPDKKRPRIELTEENLRLHKRRSVKKARRKHRARYAVQKLRRNMARVVKVEGKETEEFSSFVRRLLFLVWTIMFRIYE